MAERARETDLYYGAGELAADVLRSKYLAPGETGPYDIWERVARAMSSVEADSERWYREFFELLFDFRFVPGGRVMHGAGRDDAIRKPTLSNCYVIPIEEDSLEGIYRCIYESAMVYRTGGGVGTDLSILRPAGAPVNATVAGSPGATSFMNLFSESTNTVSQAGRRGALMLTMRVDHPDIERFIRIKNDTSRRKVQYANVSVLITHEFMQAVKDDRPFDLRWGGRTFRTVRARELWNTIVENAHASAEPGIIFWDTMREYHNVEYAHPITSTNPCAEQALASYTACNLGSVNLSRFVNDAGEFEYGTFARICRVATRFLDDVIEYNMPNHALDKIKEAVAADRRVGLGITGLADALVRMGIRYDTEEALETVENIMRTLCHNAYETSIELAQEKGAFPLFRWAGPSGEIAGGIAGSRFIQSLPAELQDRIRTHGLRNSTVITVPPVGTGSIVAQSSSGIEPIFCTSYKRRVKQADGESFAEYKVFHPLIRALFGDDEELPEYVVTAHDIDPYFRVRMQGVIQKYVDSSISSTVNLPEDVSLETVADIYITAYEAGLKGITVYREGSREGILQTDRKAAAVPAPLAQEPVAPATDGNGTLDAVSASAGANGGNGIPANGSAVDLAPSARSLAAATGSGIEEGVGTGLLPRYRPTVTRGMTERIRTGEGNLYVTINEDEKGLCEVFTSIGKAGGNAAAQSEAISRLISLCLRSGVDTLEIVKQLKGICGPNPVWDTGDLILSGPDAIGKALERYVQRKRLGQGELELPPAPGPAYSPARVGMPATSRVHEVGASRLLATCPDCGGSIVHSEGCLVCNSCGWSRC
ncbi:MAG: adenosylcobalamin-dependent ribonucleoside-diphosphate reductase [Gemmatimonadetes bacterium]|nr:adenosylcobalamin-dependent ribonucleoside-diphosphate reductase [Gemmatimonadota bacterium]